MQDNIWPLILFAPAAIIIIGGLAMLSQHYTLDNIKSRTVGDGQYGTARWATPKEISKTYQNIPFTPQVWRNGKQRPQAQGLVLGSVGRPPVPPELHLFGRAIHPPVPKRLWAHQTIHALVDCDDIHCLMIGASGVGKTAFFLYPNLEYACASGMSIFALDTKGDLARNYGTIAEKYYGYRVSVIDLRNPMHSDGYNLLTLINHYMDLFREFPNAIDYAAAAEKYTKILAKSIINPSGDAAQYGENSYFYEAAEGLMASVTLLLAQYLPPGKDEPDVRHIVSVFKLIQDLLAPDPRSRGRNGFQALMSLLPDDHKARMLAASALHTSDQAMASVMSTVLSRLNAFLDTELEQVLCFDSSIDAETFASQKCIIFLVLPEEDSTKNFMAGLLIQNLSRELFTVAEKRGGKLANRVVFLCDEFGTMPPFDVSVMSSMYLDTVYQLMDGLQQTKIAPVVCGGAYATMFPEKLLERGADFVIRSDGEHAICRLADAPHLGYDWKTIPSLCWSEDGVVRQNEIGDVLNDVDGYGIPVVNSVGDCFIDHDAITWGDPQLNTRSYEVIASRGCPFTCSYCCCVNLRRLLPKGVHGVRTRSVKSVIDELIEAKKHCKKIVFVHFYDEIFPNLPGWVDEFVEAYDKHIYLLFTIWSHSKMVELDMLKKLKRVGLTEVIMGIQSGSKRIRRDVFHRYETQEDILNAISAIQEAGVFWGSFDLMLQHPFETIEDLKESYYLVQKFPGRYELQLHGLNFLPGTDIVDMAIQQGYYTPAELDKIMYAPMEEQFGTYWKREVSQESQLWYEMIYCWQFACFRKKLRKWESNPMNHLQEIQVTYKKANILTRVR